MNYLELHEEKRKMSLYTEYLKLHKEKDRLEEQLDDKKREIKEMQERVLMRFGQEGLTKVHTELGGVRFDRTVRASAGGNVQALADAMKANGYEDMVKDTVNGNTLGAWVRRQFDPDNVKSTEEIQACLPEELRPFIKVTETIEAKPFSKKW